MGHAWLKEYMNIQMPDTSHLPPVVVKAIVVVLGVLALYLAIKIAHFLLKILFTLIGLALLGFLVWWEFFR
jgi:hypothetical protein